MRTRWTTSAIIAALALAGGAATLPTAAQTAPTTLTFVEVNHPAKDVDLDLGAPGLSRGDEQIFHATLRSSGARVGSVYGVGTVVAASHTGLTSQVLSTAALSDGGTFTLSLLFRMNFQSGPPTLMRGAVTGGTGAYRGVTGQCVSTPIRHTGNNRITCTLS